MTLTLMSILTSVLVGSILLFVQSQLFRLINRKKFISPDLLYLISILFLVRMLLPFEFGYTITIYSNHVLTFLYSVLQYALFETRFGEIKIVHLFMTVWTVGSFVSFVIFLRRYCALHNFLKLIENDRYIYNKKKNKRYPIKIIKQLDSPCVTGIFYPIILLPNVNFSDEDLGKILKHEMTHVMNFDLLFKFLLQVTTIIYWWNPVMYLISPKINQSIELRTDSAVTDDMTEKDKIDYIKLLISMRSNQTKLQSVSNFISPLSYSKKDQLLQRSVNILEEKKWRINSLSIIMIGIVAIYMVTSVVFEPDFYHKGTPEGTFRFEDAQGYLVEINENEFEVYIENEYMGIVSRYEAENLYSHFEVFKKGENKP